MRASRRYIELIFAVMLLFAYGPAICRGDQQPLKEPLSQEVKDRIVYNFKHASQAKKMNHIVWVSYMIDEDKKYFVPYLIDMVDTNELSVAFCAQAILAEITYEINIGDEINIGNDQNEWKEWWEKNKDKNRAQWKGLKKEQLRSEGLNRKSSYRFEFFDDVNDIDYLQNILENHESINTRTLAGKQLAKIRDVRVCPILVKALRTGRVHKSYIIDALIELGDVRAIEVLKEYLNDGSRYHSISRDYPNPNTTIGERAQEGIAILTDISKGHTP